MAYKRNYIEVNGKKWAFIELGISRAHTPPIIILHGVLSYADYFLSIGKGLAKDMHVIIPDIPGFGYSESPQKNHFGYVAQEVITFIKALGFSRVYIYGQSLGGTLSLAMGLMQPDLLETVYIQSPYWRKGGVNYRLLERMELFLAKLPPALIKRLASPLTIKILLKLAEYLRPDMKPLLNYNREMIFECLQLSDLKAMSEIYFSVENSDLQSKLNGDFPKSILITGENDRTIPYREMLDLKKLLRKPLVLVTGEDHEMVLDSPEKIVRIIKDDALFQKHPEGNDFYWI